MNIEKNLKIDGKKILIVGNRSYKNLGDELILLGTINLLMKEGKELYIMAFDVDWLKSFLSKFIDISKIIFLKEIPKGIRSGLNYFKEKKNKEWNIYSKIDSIIIGGGEILTEENSNSYRYRLVSILPFLFSKRKIYLMGGIQIPKKKINKYLFKLLLKKIERIYVRDYEGLEEIKKYGFNNVEFFMDTAYFAYERDKIKNKELKLKFENKYIVVNLNKNAERFFDEIIKDIGLYYNEGYDIYFVPVSKGVNNEYNDLKYFEEIKKIIIKKPNIKYTTKGGIGFTNKQKLKSLDRENDFEEFLRILKGADMVFTARLHLFIITKLLGVNVKVYPYQKKILKIQKVFDYINI